MFSILWLCLMLVLPVTGMVEPNKTKLHIAIQTRYDCFSGGTERTKFWTRYIVSASNTLGILPGYELFPDFLYINEVSTGIKIFISFGWDGLDNLIMCEAFKAGLYGEGYVWIHPTRFRSHPVTNWWNIQHDFYASVNCTVKESVAGFENQFVILDDAEVNRRRPTVLQRTVGDLIKDASKRYTSDAKNNTDVFSDALSTRLADALLTCALALNASEQEIDQRLEDIPYDSGKKLADAMYRSITRLNFKGFSGDVSFFKNGDRNGVFRVFQVKNGSMGKPVISYFELGDRMVYHQTDGQIWQHMGGIPVRDEDLIIVNVVAISHALSYTYIAIAATVAVLSLVFVITQFCYRKKSALKYSWPLLNYVIAVGCISICVVVALNGFDRERLTGNEVLLICESQSQSNTE